MELPDGSVDLASMGFAGWVSGFLQQQPYTDVWNRLCHRFFCNESITCEHTLRSVPSHFCHCFYNWNNIVCCCILTNEIESHRKSIRNKDKRDTLRFFKSFIDLVEAESMTICVQLFILLNLKKISTKEKHRNKNVNKNT